MIPRSSGPGTSGLRRVILVRAVCVYFGVCFGASCLVCFARSPIRQPTFCFLNSFCFCGGSVHRINTIYQAKFERLMCEVEFWEVFLKGAKRFFRVVYYRNSTCWLPDS